ncbi:MAG: hypothetical protein LUE24_03000 [Lachnospiraceae bacterium]|nr:hypothetical protein [Lachnospiraceae bacterium]MCD8196127.1 hypothetical protein [Lachnospiraceae bacterium]
MQTLEDLIYERLTESEALTELLAVYGDSPAVFYQKAPDDTATGWRERKQYPRLDFVADYQADPERNTSGALTVNIWCAEDGAAPEEIEPIVRGLLRGIFLTPEQSFPYSLAWSATDAFDMEKGNNLITGATVSFDLYAFPGQITCDPDPILAMNEFTRTLFPDATVIGSSELPTILTPSADAPVFYYRLQDMQIERETNTVAWMLGTLGAHVFASGEEIRWLRALVDALALRGEVMMLDKSPMFIRNIKADSAMDALAQGQLLIYVRFGLLRRRPYIHSLWVANKELTYKED